MKARGVVRLTPADAGARVTIRSLIPHAEGEPSMTDTVGILESWTDGLLRIRTKSGAVVQVDEGAMIAGRIIPSRFAQSGEERS